MSNFIKKLGQQLKFFREKQGFTQELLGRKLNVAKNTISAWENGKFFPVYLKIQKLCKALEITEEDLFSFACSSNGDGTLNLLKQLTPDQQKQINEIIKTFIKK